MPRILIAGYGDIGSGLGLKLAKADHQVFGVRRKPQQSQQNNNLSCVAADLSDPATFANLPNQIDQIVYVLSPDSRDEKAYRDTFITGLENLLVRYRQQAVAPRCLFVSSSSIYGQCRGEWVDENSATEPRSPTAQVLVEAEAKVLAENVHNTIVRFTGIYGPGREYLIRRVREGKPVAADPPRYTNRIHRDDCIGVLYFLLQKQWRGESLASVYLATDDEPAPASEVYTWIAHRLGRSAPEPVRGLLQQTNATIPDQNKRCSNRRLKTLGYQFQYPSYRDGYAALIEKTRRASP